MSDVRQRDLEERIRRFDNECDVAIRHITHLQEQARSFLHQLSCPPNELKSRFLHCTSRLDEFTYTLTEFNIAFDRLANNADVSPDANHVPVTPDNAQTGPSQPIHRSSETRDSKRSNRKRERNTLQPKREKRKIDRNSCGNFEFVERKNEIEGNGDTAIGRDENSAVMDCQPMSLPNQPRLDPASINEATILSMDAGLLWLVVDEASFIKLVLDMRKYYTHQDIVEDYIPESFCAYYDEAETKEFLRAHFFATEEVLTDASDRVARLVGVARKPRGDSDPGASEAVPSRDAGEKHIKMATFSSHEEEILIELVNKDPPLYDGNPEVFLLDTGEIRPVDKACLRPLAPQFCVTPPLAHLCCLADVEQTDDVRIEQIRAEYLKQFLGQKFRIKLKEGAKIDDPYEVYVYLEDGTSINDVISFLPALELTYKQSEHEFKDVLSTLNEEISKNFNKTENEEIPSNADRDDITYANVIPSGANNISPKPNDNEQIENKESTITDDQGMKYDDNSNLDEMLDLSKCQEYENPLEAVTGYSNRDEMDICKLYNSKNGCFKARCKKQHIKMHPGGWTLDRVSVPVKCRSAPLPAPGTWHKIKVTHVEDDCRMYLQFECTEEPITLADLVEEMTRAAAETEPLKLEPASGELVSARFSDGRYYRARVLPTEGMIEVQYIDYGNTSTVSTAHLRALQPRWLTLPVRAVTARLAGVSGAGTAAASMLRELTEDKIMEARVIARDYDEVTVKLVDGEGFDVGEQLAAVAGVALAAYHVEDDARRRCLHVPA